MPAQFYAVIYSNYYPRETYGIFATEELAEAVADGLNEVDETGMWNVETRAIPDGVPCRAGRAPKPPRRTS